MSTSAENHQLQAFARIDGARVACFWAVSFAFFVWQFSVPVLSLLSVAVGAFSIVYASVRLRRFRDDVSGGYITFGRAFVYSLMIYLYASLLFAFVQYVYFQFLDGGYLINRYMEVLGTPEFHRMMLLNGLTESDIQLAMDNIMSLRPVEVAMQFFTLDIIMGVCVSLPVALITKR